MTMLRWTTRSPWTLGFLALSAVLLLVGGGIAAAQHVALATWKPTPAMIERVEITKAQRRSGRRSRTTHTVYMPRVRYTYTTPAGPQTSTSLTYLARFPDEHRDIEDAKDWIRDLQVRQSVQAFVSPLDPSEAYLRPAAMGWPYFIILAGLGALGAAAWSFMSLTPASEVRSREVPGTSPALYELAPLQLITDRASALLSTGVASLLISILAGAQAFILPVDEASRLVFLLSAGGTTLLLLGLGLWAWLAARAFGDPRVLLLRPTLELGARTTIILEQPARYDVRVDDVLVGLVCTRTTARKGHKGRITYDRAVEHETWASLLPPSADELGLQGAQTSTHRTLRGAVQLELPRFAPPTTPPDPMGTRVDWAVVVRCTAPKAADYAGSFPVCVAA